MSRSGSRSRSRCRCALANMISRLRLKWQFLVLLYSVFSILDIVLVAVLVVDTCFCCVSVVSPFYGGCFALLFFHHLVICVVGKIQSRQHTYTDVFTYLEYCRHTQLALMPSPGAHTHMHKHS